MVSREDKRIANRSQTRIQISAPKGVQQRLATPMQLRNGAWKDSATEIPHTSSVAARQSPRFGRRIELRVRLPMEERLVIRAYMCVAERLAE